MQVVHRSRPRTGFTLMEVVISIGILAIALPLLLVTFASSSTTNRGAREDTRSALIARAMRIEIDLARLGQSQLLPQQKVTFPYPDATGRVVLLANAEGEFLRVAEGGEYDEGIDEIGAAYLVSARALERPASSTGASPGDAKTGLLTISIEAPASAPAGRRSVYEFHEVIRADATNSTP